MRTLSLSDVKTHLSELADEVDRTHERLHVTKNGRDYVVVMSAEDLESIEATLELLADPEAQERLDAAGAEAERGEGLDEAQVRALMRDARESQR
jgi:prevent-host-death family protein